MDYSIDTEETETNASHATQKIIDASTRTATSTSRQTPNRCLPSMKHKNNSFTAKAAHFVFIPVTENTKKIGHPKIQTHLDVRIDKPGDVPNEALSTTKRCSPGAGFRCNRLLRATRSITAPPFWLPILTQKEMHGLCKTSHLFKDF